MRRLLRGGASAETTDEDGVTPLQLASLEGHVHVCSALIEEGRAAAGAADAHRRTPLHFASEEGHAAAAAPLVMRVRGGALGQRYGHAGTGPPQTLPRPMAPGGAHLWALVCGAGGGGTPAVADACAMPRAPQATLLLRHGAAVSAADCDGMTPLHLSAEQAARACRV